MRAEHGNQRPLEIGVEIPETLFAHLRRKHRFDPPGCVGILARVFGDLRNGDLIHPELVFPFADQVGDRNHRVVEQALG